MLQRRVAAPERVEAIASHLQLAIEEANTKLIVKGSVFKLFAI